MQEKRLEKFKNHRRHHHNNPEILLTESRPYVFLEKVGFILHIIALILGISAIIGLGVGENERLNILLEEITLLVVVLILLNYISKPFIKKFLVRRFFNQFWFQTEIVNTFYIPIKISDKVKVINGNEYLDIKFKKFVSKDLVKIDFKRTSFLKWELIIKYHLRGKFDVNLEWRIDHIFIDVKRRILEMEIFLEKEFYEKLKEIEKDIIIPSENLNYTIDLYNKRASWIGKNHNNLPTWLGEWSVENMWEINKK